MYQILWRLQWVKVLVAWLDLYYHNLRVLVILIFDGFKNLESSMFPNEKVYSPWLGEYLFKILAMLQKYCDSFTFIGWRILVIACAFWLVSACCKCWGKEAYCGSFILNLVMVEFQLVLSFKLQELYEISVVVRSILFFHQIIMSFQTLVTKLSLPKSCIDCIEM